VYLDEDNDEVNIHRRKDRQRQREQREFQNQIRDSAPMPDIRDII
jgi:hypothetical protein